MRIGRQLFLEPSLDFVVNRGFVATMTVKMKESMDEGGESNHLSLFVLSFLESPTDLLKEKAHV